MFKKSEAPFSSTDRFLVRGVLTRITAILAETRGVTADIGLRLDRYFGLSAGYWLGLQQDYDLRQAKGALGRTLDRVKPRVLAGA